MTGSSDDDLPLECDEERRVESEFELESSLSEVVSSLESAELESSELSEEEGLGLHKTKTSKSRKQSKQRKTFEFSELVVEHDA